MAKEFSHYKVLKLKTFKILIYNHWYGHLSIYPKISLNKYSTTSQYIAFNGQRNLSLKQLSCIYHMFNSKQLLLSMVLPSLQVCVQYNFFNESPMILDWIFNHKIGTKLILVHLNVKTLISITQQQSSVIPSQLIDFASTSNHSY